MVLKRDSVQIVQIPSEIEDDYSDDSLFNITSWGADLSCRELISMYEEGEMMKPEMQRNYVWDRNEASRFIESILMGLPVPSIFLAQVGSHKLIVDGYQRIMSIHGYVTGTFPGDGKLFRLTNTEKINERWRGKSYIELISDDQRKLRATTIHAIVFEQKSPKNNDTSMFQIFERINTSGRTLYPQEIRNCIYQGSFNELLISLNMNETWRRLFGSKTPDIRMRDMEYILRFFYLISGDMDKASSKQISLKKELSEYMGKNQHLTSVEAENLKLAFIKTIESIMTNVGIHAFNNYSSNGFLTKFHPTIFDAIAIAYYEAIRNNEDLRVVPPESQIALLEDPDFVDAISIRTTNIEKIERRIQLAKEYLLGVPHEKNSQ